MSIVVVGAGLVGCAVAHELASRGARIRIVDPRRDGGSASQASAGTLAPYIEGHSPELRALGVTSDALFDAFIARVRAEASCDVEYARCGTLQVSRSRQETEVLEEAARALRAEGVVHELMGAASASALEPGLADIEAALHIPGHGLVGVQALTRALEEAATRRGATRSHARVTALSPTDRGVNVTTDKGVESAAAVVIAAGSWSAQIVQSNQESKIKDPQSTVRPIRGQLVHVSLEQSVVSRMIWGAGCYLVPWRDGSVLVGATVEDVGFDESATPEGQRSLLLAAADLVPALRGARVKEVRVGLRPKTPDELPIIGRSSTMPHVYYATGHYRTGVLLAPLTAALVADLVLDGGERPELAAVRPDRLGL